MKERGNLYWKPNKGGVNCFMSLYTLFLRWLKPTNVIGLLHCPITNCPLITWEVERIRTDISTSTEFTFWNYKTIKILSIFQTKHNHSDSSVSESNIFAFAHAGLDHFHFQKKPKEIGKFWRKSGMCYRDANFCQIVIGKLKTLGRKRKKNFITTWRFMRTFEADKRLRLLTLFFSLSVEKRTIKKSSYIKRHWSKLGVLCQVLTHTCTLSDCELSKHMLKN